MAKLVRTMKMYKSVELATVNSFERLPDDVLAQILSYLPKVSLVRLSIVNSRWHRVSFDASLWRDVCIPFDFRHNVQDSTLMKLTACSRNVYKLYLVECRNLTDELLRFISVHCPNLKKLQLCGCVDITDKGMTDVARRCTRLRKLGIAKTKVTDRSLNILIQNNPDLTTLETSTQACTVDTLASLRNCKTLRKLKVYETPEEVLVKDTRILLDDSMFEALGKSCPNLTDLVLIYDNVEASDSSVRELARGCPLLENIEIDSCPEVGDQGIKALVKNGCLEHLHLGESRVSDETLRAVATYLPKIRSLKLEYADVTDNGVFHLMGNCKFLEELSLGVKIPENLTDITASIISCLSGPFLCSLEFNSCAITDRGLAILVTDNSVLLTSLSIKACTQITFDGLMKCLKRCQGLRLLDVFFSGLVQNVIQLMDIAEILPNLCSLGAVDVEGVSEKDLETFQSLYPLCDVRL
ncbi:F-box/LRR-repeat protein 7-like [Dendronephthya gigantea]|uniref:F-box/LRR-repeat protein 7-like n=1 Tax=Dendronephthya gigantea TaxID=151771 RepID=UPI00106C393A|nr:F-box/LRR-repeat protein 7-like [Dendronephthya gigantea]